MSKLELRICSTSNPLNLVDNESEREEKDIDWWQRPSGDDFVARESVDEETLRRGLGYRIDEGNVKKLPLNFRLWEMFFYGYSPQSNIIFRRFWVLCQLIFLIYVVLVTLIQLLNTHNGISRLEIFSIFLYIISVSLPGIGLFLYGGNLMTKKDVYAIIEMIGYESGEKGKTDAYVTLTNFTWLAHFLFFTQYSFGLYAASYAVKVEASYYVLFLLYIFWSLPTFNPFIFFSLLWLWTLQAIRTSNLAKIKKMITLDKIHDGSAAKEVILGMANMHVICNRWKLVHIIQLAYAGLSLLENVLILYTILANQSYYANKDSYKFLTLVSTLLNMVINYSLVWVSCVATGYVNDNYFKEINIRILEVLAGVKNVKHETTIEKVSRRNKYRLKEGKGGTSTKNVDTSDIEVEISRVEVDVEREVLTVEHRLRLHNLRHITQMKGTMGLNYGGIVLSFKSGLAIGTFITTALYSLLSSAVNAAL